MNTISGLWTIFNTTRYNTEDLVSVFNAYEAFLRATGRPLEPNRNRPEGTVRFADFTPMNRTYRYLQMDGTGCSREVTGVCYVRGASLYTKHMRDIGLTKPSKLYGSPMEALSAPRGPNGEELAPDGFVQQLIADGVRSCYLPYVGIEDLAGFPYADLSIRVERRRSKAPEMQVRRGDRVSALCTAHDGVKWAVQGLRPKLDELQAQFNLTSVRFNDLDLPRALTQDQLDQAFAVIEHLETMVRNDSQTIAQELE